MRIANFVAAILGCILLSLAFAQQSEISAPPIISQSTIDAFVVEHPMFSGSVIVVQNGEILGLAHTGFADRQSKMLNDDKTLFSIASVGKMFTAVAIVQLVQANKIGYETAVIDVIPELGEHLSESISIDHLLRHTSGLDRLSQADDETLSSLRSNHDYFALLLANGIGSSGPAEFSYANENYQILGEVIERVSGQSYESFIQDSIAEPAGMAGPVFDLSGQTDTRNVASNYMAVDFETWWNSEEPIVASSADEFVHLAPRSTPSAGGGSYTTAMDMIRFATALRAGTLISPDGFDAMCSIPIDESTMNRGYGRGCSVDMGPHGVRIGHTGSTAGVQARFFLYREQAVDVVVLSNHDEQAAPLFREINNLIR